MLQLGLIVLPTLIPNLMKAEEPAFIVISGNAEFTKTLELNKYNRITFYDECISLSSSKDDTIERIDLLYSLYNHIKFSNEGNVSVADINTTTSTLSCDIYSKTLNLYTQDNAADYNLGIFSANGTMIYCDKFTSDGKYSISNLMSGVYIAVATNGKTNLTLKFIIK